MKYLYFAATRRGSGHNNEDRVFIDGRTLQQGGMFGLLESSFTAVVCDGVGANYGGAFAAHYLADSFRQFRAGTADSAKLKEHLYEANLNIMEHMEIIPEYRDMATTIAGIIVNHDNALLFSAGDSRIYGLFEKRLKLLTTDHTLAQDRLSGHDISRIEDAPRSEQNTLTRYFGGDGDYATADIQSLNIPDSAASFLICSDGLYKSVPTPVLSEILSGAMPIEEKGMGILKFSEKYANDDVSLVILEKCG